jgi:REP element-mobilizing transposase RayT
VINRGNYRRDLFRAQGAAEAFERTLAEAAERFGWRVAAYVVMRNHFHIAVETPEPNLSVGMKWLQGTWARRFNRFRSLEGRPFQGRFKSLVVEDAAGYRRVCDYIHLNPARAKVVAAEDIASYRHSSLWHYAKGSAFGWLDPSCLLAAYGLTKNTAGWRAYGVQLGVLLGDKQARAQLCAKQLSRGWCIGSKAFKTTMQESLRDQLAQWRERRFVGLGPDELKEERSQCWEEALTAYARTAQIELSALGPKKSAPEKVLLAAAMKHSTSVSNGWLAERLSMGQPASVSQFARRWMQTQEGRHATEALVSRVKV